MGGQKGGSGVSGYDGRTERWERVLEGLMGGQKGGSGC